MENLEQEIIKISQKVGFFSERYVLDILKVKGFREVQKIKDILSTYAAYGLLELKNIDNLNYYHSNLYKSELLKQIFKKIKGFQKILIICDIDGTIIFSPYQCPIFLKFDIEIQHKVCQGSLFREYLKKAQLLPYFKQLIPLFILSNKIIFLTGRNKYNKSYTEPFLYKHFYNFFRFELVFMEFKSFDQLVTEKIKYIKQVSKDYRKVIVFEDLKDILIKLNSPKFVKVFVNSNVCKRKYNIEVLK